MADEKPKLTPAEKSARVEKKLAAKQLEMKDFLKGNKLSSKEDHSKHKDKTIASAYKALKLELADLEAKKIAAGGKKKKAGKAGVTAKYSYPATVKTSDDKKKYRTHIRGLAKKNGVTVEEVLKNVAKFEKATPAKKEAPAKKKAKKAEAEEPAKKKKKAKPAPVVEEEEEEEEGGPATEEEEEEWED
jgi:hypothetical protein